MLKIIVNKICMSYQDTPVSVCGVLSLCGNYHKDEFVERCKEMESEVAESATAPMGEGAQMGSDGKRKLQMDKNKNIVLIEPDGTETPITMRDAAFTYGSSYVLRLTTGIACGGDISTVELD